jgi:hypothetical protein
VAAVEGSSFGDLRKLADWFTTSPTRLTNQVERLTRRLGVTAVPLLGRELRHADPRRRDAAREALAWLATTSARARVIAELHAVTTGTATDEAKVSALGLLAELGEHAEAVFADPSAMQRRSAIALAAQLENAPDIANAADMMVRQLDADDIVHMLEALYDAAPAAAHRLISELAARLDLPLEQRERIVAIVATGGTTPAPSPGVRRIPRPTQVAVLVDAINRDARAMNRDARAMNRDAPARLVVVASRKIAGERRWRRWAVLIGATGRIEDCVHDDVATVDGDAAALIASLCADGYRVASTDVDHARTIVAAAARVTASEPEGLSSAYYVGRDLLDLGDAHIPRGARRIASGRDSTATMLGHAIDLLAAGDVSRAKRLLECFDPDNAEVCAALAACALADGKPAGAIEPLSRAITLEPTWPLHHWNLAVALHQLGDTTGCYHAMRRFISTSAAPTALHGDPEQPSRIAAAERLLGELERSARLAGISLGGRRRHNRRRKSPARR